MTGQEFLKIQDQKIFRPAVMDAVINEFEPAVDSFLLTNKFMPMKDVMMDELVALIKAGAFGKTNPVALGGEHTKINMPTHYYKDFRGGYWRESVMFDEEVLTRVKNPEKTDELWGEGLVGEALNVLDIRLNTLIEYLTAQTILTNGYTVARAGVNYSYSAGLPTKYYLDVAATAASGFVVAPWGNADNNRWSALTTSNPLTDIREAIKKMGDYGFGVDEIYMTRTVAGYIEDNTTSSGIRSLIAANPAIAGQMITAELLITGLSGLKGIVPVIDDRRYQEEFGLQRALAASGTTLYLGEVDASAVASGDKITIRDTSTGNEEELTCNAVSATAGTIGVSAGPTNAYPVGSRVTISKKFLKDDRVIFHGKGNGRVSYSNWVSTPSLIKAKDFKNPLPGRYTWSTFHSDVPYWVEVGAGIHGGPMVYSGGGWLVLKIAA
jgi:hypothetical protein